MINWFLTIFSLGAPDKFWLQRERVLLVHEPMSDGLDPSWLLGLIYRMILTNVLLCDMLSSYTYQLTKLRQSIKNCNNYYTKRTN